MNVDVVKILIAIQELEKKAGKMRHEANQLMSKSEGFDEAAKDLREEFAVHIEFYEKKQSEMKSL